MLLVVCRNIFQSENDFMFPEKSKWKWNGLTLEWFYFDFLEKWKVKSSCENNFMVHTSCMNTSQRYCEWCTHWIHTVIPWFCGCNQLVYDAYTLHTHCTYLLQRYYSARCIIQSELLYYSLQIHWINEKEVSSKL